MLRADMYTPNSAFLAARTWALGECGRMLLRVMGGHVSPGGRPEAYMGHKKRCGCAPGEGKAPVGLVYRLGNQDPTRNQLRVILAQARV